MPPLTSAITFLLSSKSALFPASALIMLGFPATDLKIKGVIKLTHLPAQRKVEIEQAKNSCHMSGSQPSLQIQLTLFLKFYFHV